MEVLRMAYKDSDYSSPAFTDTDRHKNLHDVQKLLGTINWVWLGLGISNEDLSPLFELLKGNTDLCSPRSLGLEAVDSLLKVATAITQTSTSLGS